MKGVEKIGLGDIVINENESMRVFMELNKNIQLYDEDIVINMSGYIKIETKNKTKLIKYDERVIELEIEELNEINAVETLMDINMKYEEFKNELRELAEEIYRFLKYAIDHNWNIIV